MSRLLGAIRYKLIQLLKGKNNLLSLNATIGKSNKILDTKASSGVTIGDYNYIVGAELSGTISIGNHTRIKETFIIGEDVTIGDHTSLWGPGTSIHQKHHPVRIGKFCSIARQVNLYEFNHNQNKLSTYYIGKNLFKEDWDNESTSKGPIIIGNDVWIGAGVKILSGVTIGNGCIIAANSVVTKDCPPYSIIGGIPGKVISSRFSEETIALLHEVKWWDWDIEKIKKNKSMFQISDEKELVKTLQNSLNS